MDDGTTIPFSRNNEKHIHGVALMITIEKAKTLIEWEPVSVRMLRGRFLSKSNLRCCLSTNDAEDEIKELQRLVSKVPHHDMMLIIGDLDAKVGADNSNWERG